MSASHGGKETVWCRWPLGIFFDIFEKIDFNEYIPITPMPKEE